MATTLNKDIARLMHSHSTDPETLHIEKDALHQRFTDLIVDGKLTYLQRLNEKYPPESLWYA